MNEQILDTFDKIESIFSTLENAAKELDIPLDSYLPEPKSLADIKNLPQALQCQWLAVSKKEVKFIIKNGTIDGGKRQFKREMK